MNTKCLKRKHVNTNGKNVDINAKNAYKFKQSKVKESKGK